MARPEDVATMRLVRKELARRPIDISRMQIYVMHRIVYFRGQAKAARGHELDLKAEFEIIAKILRTKPEIRDVVLDLIYRT